MKPVGSIWTDEQWQAIEESGNNIIVSAGAGSGKTAVLTERVIYKLKQGVNINDLIVLTFTNAAAKEMKERIRENIKKEDSLKKQLALIDSAQITTFDAYSLSIVKKYHYLLNLKKEISIIDNIYLKINKKKILDEIFLEMYDNYDFIDFIDTFTNKDDNIIKNKIDEINNKISGIYDKSKIFDSNIKVEDILNDYLDLLKENIDIILKLTDEIIENVKDDRIIEYVIDIKKAFDIEKNIENILNLKNYKFKSFPRNKDLDPLDSELAKKYITKIKEYYKEIEEITDYESLNEIELELNESIKYVNIILEILKKYNDKIFEFKLQNNAFEFNDILFLSIKILTENKDILDEIKYKTNEIMVDEFQDTNDNNEYFLSLISNDNLYMVGDVKQSIYKFRNANSKIFTNTYYNYKNGNGITIDLNKNFRSRKEVLESINLIFEHIMDYFIGGVDYDENQKLKFGNTSYQDNNCDNNLEILNYEYENYKKDFTKEEVEIFIIADDIINKVKNKYQVFDIKKKVFRDIKYSDFVILLDRKTSFELYKKIFEYKNIPLMMHKEENFSYNNVIFVLKNILKIINAFYLKDFTDINYSLVSLYRSYICEYSDEIILKNIDNLIGAEEFKEVIEKLKYLSLYYKKHSLKELMLELYKTFNLYMLSIKIKDVKENNIKLDYLITVVTNLEALGYDLTDFVNYFDEMYESGTDITFSTQKENSNAVNIMTIHKSKGLEFPICYYASLYKEFNVRDVNDSFLYDSKYNIISPVFKEGIKDTILKKLVKKNYLKEDIEEKIRLFYVALTRAKEKIIMVSNINELESLELPFETVVNNLERLKYRSFNDMLVSIKKYLKPFIKNIKVEPDKNYELLKESNYQNNLVINKKEFVYKSIDIKLAEKQDLVFSNIYDISRNDTFELGNMIHEVLEYLDFNNYLNDLENYDIDESIKEKIKILFTMPFMKNIKNIYKEYEFILDDKLGIIDLLLESDDKYIVVDYKTKEINKESYINQVKNYINYVKTITDKKVEGYLYSIINSEYIKIDEI